MTEFEILQENLEARLNAIAFFSDVTVVAMKSRMVGTKLVTIAEVDELLELALQGRRLKAGKTGAAVAIMKAGFEARLENLPGPQGKMVIAVRVQVDPAVNGLASIGTGKSAEEIALEVLKAGHQFQIGGVGTLKAGADAFVPDLSFAPKETIWVVFELVTNVQVAAKCVMPTVAAGVGATVVLASATSGADVYYSVNDGELPRAGNGTLYTVPVTVETGDVVRAVAYKTGLVPSDVVRATITL